MLIWVSLSFDKRLSYDVVYRSNFDLGAVVISDLDGDLFFMLLGLT